MANIEEIALGIASVLIASDKPEPLGVDLLGQNGLEIALLVKRVIDECADADCPLSTARVARNILPFFQQGGNAGQTQHRETPLVVAVNLHSRVEFFRSDPD